MTTNKPLDLQELRTLAAKASPGPWWIDSHGHSMSDRNHKTVFQAVDLVKPAFRNPETGNLSHWPNDWDASFIAAANPETVLSLLDTIETLQAKCEQLRKDAELWESIHDEIHRRADKEHALADQCDFDVTIMYEDYAAIDAAMEKEDKP